MTRPRRTSTIGVERHIARVISDRLRQLGWSYHKLAAAMKREGCDIAASSLRQSVVPRPNSRGEPRLRPIAVDELVALSRVFDMPLERLVAGDEWVDDEQVRQALQSLTHANRLLLAAVKTMLDAEVTLVRATERASQEVQGKMVDEPNRRWRASTQTMRLKPDAAKDNSPRISPEALSDALSDMKGLIAAMALDWCQRDDDERMLDRLGQPVPQRAAIGSRSWLSHLNVAVRYHTDPDPDDHLPTEAMAVRETARRVVAQDPTLR